MADDKVPQEPTIEHDTGYREADEDEAPQPPAPGPDGDRPVQDEDAAIRRSADRWDVPDKPGDNG